MGLEGLIDNGKAVIEGLREFWSDRSSTRSTRGTPERTQLTAFLRSIHRIAPELEADELLEDLQDGWASEEGWDTEKRIEGVKATGKVQMVQEQGKKERGE